MAVKAERRAARFLARVLPDGKERSFPPFFHPCVAVLAEAPPEGAAWVYEIKHDGYRVQAHANRGHVGLYTRRGYDWTERFGSLASDVASLPVTNAVIDREVASTRAAARTTPRCKQILREGGVDASPTTCSICSTSMVWIHIGKRPAAPRAPGSLYSLNAPLDEPIKKPKATWVEPVVDAEIAYSTRTPEGLLREAVFKGVRDDLAPMCPLEKELGLYVCGGRGKHSRREKPKLDERSGQLDAGRYALQNRRIGPVRGVSTLGPPPSASNLGRDATRHGGVAARPVAKRGGSFSCASGGE